MATLSMSEPQLNLRFRNETIANGDLVTKLLDQHAHIPSIYSVHIDILWGREIYSSVSMCKEASTCMVYTPVFMEERPVECDDKSRVTL